MAPDPATDAWTVYWSTGAAGSCFHGAVEVRFAEVWGALTDQLGDGARLLDLATGNGAAARACAARAAALGLKLHVEGVDAAVICPDTVPDHGRSGGAIVFQSGVALELLPYPDAAFDAVISQFGFEYADEPRAAAEAARVLAPGGKLRFVMHARDGAMHADIESRVRRLRAALHDHGPAGLARTLAAAASVGDAATLKRASDRLPQAIAEFREAAAHAPPDDAAVFYVNAFLRDWAERARYRPADLHRAIDAGWRTANGVAARQEQMLRAARSRGDMDALATRFSALGLQVAHTILCNEARGAQVAWQLDAARPGDR